MNPYYVTRCWNNELKKCVYKVMERRWFQLARYLISIGSLSDQAAEEYENNGYKLERLPREERIVKSKREAMMNNAFNKAVEKRAAEIAKEKEENGKNSTISEGKQGAVESGSAGGSGV